MMKRVLTGVIGLIAVLLIYMFVTTPSPCDDDIRSYESRLAADIEYIKKEAQSIGTSIGVTESKAYQDLQDLTVAKYAALRFCVSDCRLLESCARWRFFSSPATACPTEYSGYRARVIKFWHYS